MKKGSVKIELSSFNKSRNWEQKKKHDKLVQLIQW